MKIILTIFLLLAPGLQAQVLKETIDKFQNLHTVFLEDMIDLDVKDASSTSDFEINMYKITKEGKIVYAFQIITETEELIKCPEESKCIFLYNDSTTIELFSVFRTYQIFKRTITTAFQIPTSLEDLLTLKDASKIEVKIYCDGASYEGRFRKDDLKEFKSGIKMLTK